MDASVTIITQVPAGTSLDYRGGTLPFGFLVEDGSVVDRVTYARLFEAIGTTYGAGNGTTTFKIPDSRGRVNVASGTGSGLTARTQAATGGEETHVLTESEIPSHTHTQNPHIHGDGAWLAPEISLVNGTAGTTIANGLRPIASLGATSGEATSIRANTTSTTATNQNTGGGNAHNNMQPFIVATRMIKY